MKKLFAVLFAVACLNAGAQTMAPGLISNYNIGANASSRTDAQAEFRNDGGVGHGMVTIKQMVNPGAADREAGLNFSAFDTQGIDRQLGSLSYQWANSPLYNGGYAVARLEVNTVAGSGEVPFRCWGGQMGCVFFGANGMTGDHTPAGGPFVSINRASGFPSITGVNDLVLEGKGRGAGDLYLNQIGGGTVWVGGTIRLSNPGSPGCPTSIPSGVHHCTRFVDVDGLYSYWPVYR